MSRHAERLAKVSRKGFPKWAPTEVILVMNEQKIDLGRQRDVDNDPRRGCPDMLRRLLTYEGMQDVWIALSLSKKKFPDMVFAAVAVNGFCGPLDEARLTPTQHQKYVAKVQKLARELSRLLRGTHLDFNLMAHLDLLNHGEVGRHIWWRFSQLLDNVAAGAPYLAKESAGKRISGEDARRAYFVRQLTKFFREYLGGPRRALVAIATAAAFDDPSFGVRQVTRLAP